jgi:hypothetical protein
VSHGFPHSSDGQRLGGVDGNVVPTALFVIWMFCGIIGALVATGKDRPAWHGAALGFLLGLIGLLIIAVLPRRVAT